MSDEPGMAPDYLPPTELGVTLRDFFAAQALQGILAGRSGDPEDDLVAQWAYALADAMLAQRQRR